MKDNYDEYCADPEFERMTDKILPWMWRVGAAVFIAFIGVKALSFCGSHHASSIHTAAMSSRERMFYLPVPRLQVHGQYD